MFEGKDLYRQRRQWYAARAQTNTTAATSLSSRPTRSNDESYAARREWYAARAQTRQTRSATRAAASAGSGSGPGYEYRHPSLQHVPSQWSSLQEGGDREDNSEEGIALQEFSNLNDSQGAAGLAGEEDDPESGGEAVIRAAHSQSAQGANPRLALGLMVSCTVLCTSPWLATGVVSNGLQRRFAGHEQVAQNFAAAVQMGFIFGAVLSALTGKNHPFLSMFALN